MKKRRYHVLWTRSARRDLEAIFEYISIDKKETAIKIVKKIQRTTSRLRSFPERGRIVPELKQQGISIYRKLIITPWRVMYRISGHTVFVLAVIDSRRNVEDVLLERLTR